MNGILRPLASIFCLIAHVADASQEAHRPAFADHLFEQGRYFDAITEYKRFAFRAEENANASYTWYRAGLAYGRIGLLDLEQGNLKRAQELARGDFERTIQWALAESYANQGFPKPAFRVYDELISTESSRETLSELHMQKAMLAVKLVRPELALYESERALFIAKGDRRRRLSLFVQQLRSSRKVPYRSPVLAKWLSFALPGAGQVYAGQTRRGLKAFLLNGLLAYAAYTSLSDRLYWETGLFYAIVWHRYHVGNAEVASAMAVEFNAAAWQRQTADLQRIYEDE